MSYYHYNHYKQQQNSTAQEIALQGYLAKISWLNRILVLESIQIYQDCMS